MAALTRFCCFIVCPHICGDDLITPSYRCLAACKRPNSAPGACVGVNNAAAARHRFHSKLLVERSWTGTGGSMHCRAAVDQNRLPGHEVAVMRSEKEQRP